MRKEYEEELETFKKISDERHQEAMENLNKCRTDAEESRYKEIEAKKRLRSMERMHEALVDELKSDILENF